MNRIQIAVCVAVTVFVTVLVMHLLEDISISEVLGLEEAQQAAAAEQETGPAALSFAELQSLLANLDANQRQALLADAAAFKQFVLQQASNASVLSAAKANKVDEDANTAFLMQRSADNVLRESYLSKLIAGKLPADFPSEEQAREYFEQNRENFTVPERVHVWQVFLEVPAAAGDEEVAEREIQAQRLAQDIRSGKLDFAVAAEQYSDHEQSKLSGGYMGLVKVPELKPAIAEPLLALPEDRSSAPIKTDTGFHVVKRGAKVPALKVEFAQVDAQIRQLLRQQAVAQLRQAVYEQAGKTYPVELQDAQIEEWRAQLSEN